MSKKKRIRSAVQREMGRLKKKKSPPETAETNIGSENLLAEPPKSGRLQENQNRRNEETTLSDMDSGVEDLQDFDAPPKKRFNYLWIVLLLIAGAGIYFWFPSFAGADKPKVYFSKNFLDQGEVPSGEALQVDGRIIITFDNNSKPINAEYLQFDFAKYQNKKEKTKFFNTEIQRVIPKERDRLEHLIQKKYFSSTGPGIYKVTIKDPAGKIVAEADMKVE